MKKKNFFLIIVITITGCQPIFNTLYGVKKIRKVDSSKIDSFYKRFNLESFSTIKIISDSTKFYTFRKIPISKKNNADFSQPIQIIYFDNNKLASFHANCYAQGKLTNLNWNVAGRFNTFTPSSAINLDSCNLDRSKFYQTFNINPTQSRQYTIIIFWTLMFEKLSTDALNLTLDNVKSNSKNENCDIYFINNDETFINK